MPIELSVIPSTFIYVSGMIQKAIYICQNLKVNPSRMLENLHLLKGLNLSEGVATTLAERGLGRYTSYDLMREIVKTVYTTGEEFRNVLKKHETVTRYLTDKEIDELTEPSSDLGTIQEQIDITLKEIERDYRKGPI